PAHHDEQHHQDDRDPASPTGRHLTSPASTQFRLLTRTIRLSTYAAGAASAKPPSGPCMCRASHSGEASPAIVRPASAYETARSTSPATSAVTRPASAALEGCNPTSTEPRYPAATVPAMAPRMTPIEPRGTWGLVRGDGRTMSASRATTSATP